MTLLSLSQSLGHDNHNVRRGPYEILRMKSTNLVFSLLASGYYGEGAKRGDLGCVFIKI